MIQLSEQQVIEQITERLAGAYPSVAPDIVSRLVNDKHAWFDGHPLRDYVPLFVERHAKAELSKLGG